MYRNLSFIANEISVNVLDLLNIGKRVFKKRVKASNNLREKWKVDLIMELIDCKENIRFNGFDHEDITYLLRILCTG